MARGRCYKKSSFLKSKGGILILRLGYVVSMFPCWSETFILNEIVNHSNNGINLTIFSLKNFNEDIIHSEADLFISLTQYPLHLLNPYLWFLHLLLFLRKPRLYLTVLSTLFRLKSSSNSVKIKALIIFLLSPPYIQHAIGKHLDHLHAHFATYPAIMAWVVSTFSKTPFSVTAHAHDIYVNQDLLPIIYTHAANIFTISQFNKNFILDKVGNSFQNKIKVLHCGINIEKFPFDTHRQQFDNNNSINILSIGRLSGIKGFSYLLDALKLLRDDRIDFKCQIIGDGPLKSQLLEQTEELGLSRYVYFLGSKTTDEIPSYLKSADVFVLACANDKIEGHDGIPLVFMEAMAYGVPVIGTRLSGIPELIRHKETGLCASPENPGSIKDNLLYFIKHPSEVQKMRFAARELIEAEFNINTICGQLRKIYQPVSVGE
jgi:glycosyltransferase involved in cell wall biosynthesis